MAIEMTKGDLEKMIEGVVEKASSKRAEEFDAYLADATREVAGDEAADEMQEARERGRRDLEDDSQRFKRAMIRGDLSTGQQLGGQNAVKNADRLPWQQGSDLDGFGRGHNFGAAMLLYARARSEGTTPEKLIHKLQENDQLARNGVTDMMTRTVQASSFASGGWDIEEVFVSDLIPALYATSIVLQSGVMTMDMGTGSVRIPKQTGTSTAYWVGENDAITKSEITGGDVKLSAKKLGVLIPLSNDWIRRANGNGNEIATRDAVNVGAQARDLAYLRGAGSSNEPNGLINQAGTTLDAATGGSTELDDATEDVMSAMFNVANSDVPRVRPAWYMSVREEFALKQIRTSDGNFAFAPEMANGTLMGVPYYSTTQIPTNLDITGDAANDETDLYFVETTQVIVGITLDMAIEFLPNAAYNDGSNDRFGSQRDESLVRLISETDIQLRHPEGVAVVREIDRGTGLES